MAETKVILTRTVANLGLYGDVVGVLGILKQAGGRHVSIATETARGH